MDLSLVSKMTSVNLLVVPHFTRHKNFRDHLNIQSRLNNPVLGSLLFLSLPFTVNYEEKGDSHKRLQSL